MYSSQSSNTFKHLDSYSMLICSKFLQSEQDYINIICVCKKFKETTEKLRFNPIPITSLKLFPKIQTQYLYSSQDKIIEKIDNYETLHTVNYGQYLEFKKDNISCRHVRYTNNDVMNYSDGDDDIPHGVNILGSFFSDSDITSITIPNFVTKIENNCFSYRRLLGEVDLSEGLTEISDECFSCCESLWLISIPSSIKSIGTRSFFDCNRLSKITIPNSVTSIGSGCFEECLSLQSITLSPPMSMLPKRTFYRCISLTQIILPTTITSIAGNCFGYCSSLTTISLPSSLERIGPHAFEHCSSLQTNLPSSIKKIGKKCFTGCDVLNKNRLKRKIW